jgi:hypothetical protein
LFKVIVGTVIDNQKLVTAECLRKHTLNGWGNTVGPVPDGHDNAEDGAVHR